MGIRIHKAIGYGLSDVKVDDEFGLCDERFYKRSAFMYARNAHYTNAERSAEDVYTLQGFIDFCQTHLHKTCALLETHALKRLDTWDIDSCFIHETESDLNNVFIVIPPTQSDWYRYNDIIDYIELTNSTTYTDSFKHVQQGIYPYSGVHQNAKGERLKPIKSCSWWRWYNSCLDGDIPQEHIQLYNILMDESSRSLGFKDFHDARDNIAPYVPDIVRAFCTYTKLFVDPNMVLRLRPMLYTWWC